MDRIISRTIDHLYETLSYLSFNSPIDKKISEKQTALISELQSLIEYSDCILEADFEPNKLVNYYHQSFRFFSNEKMKKVLDKLSKLDLNEESKKKLSAMIEALDLIEKSSADSPD